MAEGIRAGDVVVEIVAVVRAIGQVEGLHDQLRVHPFTEFEVLCQSHVQLKEGVSPKRVVLGDRAIRCDSIQAIEAVLSTCVVARKGKPVCRVTLQNYHGTV